MKKFLLKIVQILLIGLAILFLCYLLLNMFFYVYEQHRFTKESQINLELKYQQENPNSHEFLNELNSLINENYNKSIDYLNVSIILFSCSLAIFLVLVGLISYSKIKEINAALFEIKEFPEKAVNSFNKKQLDNLLTEMFSDDGIKRTNAIKQLSLNPEVNKDHFNLFFQCLRNELFSVNFNIRFNNIPSIIDILSRINYLESVEKILNLMASSLDNEAINKAKITGLLPFISSITIREYEEDIKKILQEKENNIGDTLLIHLIMNSNITDGFLDIIFRNNNLIQQVQFLNLVYNYNPNFNDEIFVSKILRIDIDQQLVSLIASSPVLIKKMEFKNRYSIVLKYTKDNYTKKQSTVSSINQQFIKSILMKRDQTQYYIDIIKKEEFYVSLYQSLKPSLPEFKTFDIDPE